MRKRLLSLAMTLCMVLSLLPAAAFADENAEAAACVCEEACTAEDMNAECPVCGAEGAAVESCGKYTVPATEAQAEVAKTEDTEPETDRTEAAESPETALSETTGSGETGQGTAETEEAGQGMTETEEAGQEMTETEDAWQETTEPEDAGTEGTESEVPVCNCEGSCTAENMNESCPVCGAEGAAVESCREYVAPAVEEQTEEVVRQGAPAGEEPEQTAVEKVQAMIDALPTVEELENADAETVDAAYAAVQDVCDALDKLSTEERDQLTGRDKLDALLEWFNGQVAALDNGMVTNEAELRKAVAAAASGDTITLGADIALSEVLEINCPETDYISLTLNMNGHTLNGSIKLTGCYFTVNGQLDANVEANGYSGSGGSWPSILSGGTYAGKVVLNKSGIASGTFKGEVLGSGEIDGGIFYEDVTCEVAVGGTFLKSCWASVIERGIFYGEHDQDKMCTTSGAIIYKNDDQIYAIEYKNLEVVSTPFSGVTPVKEGCTFLGWYEKDDEGNFIENRYEFPGQFGMNYGSRITLHARWEENNNYSVAFDTNGGNDIESKTGVKWTDQVLAGITDPAKDGWEFTGWKYGDKTVTEETTYRQLASSDAVESIILTAQWKDIAGPTGIIRIGANSWPPFPDNITFGLFFKDTQTVTITASDNSGEAVTIGYLLSDHALPMEIIMRDGKGDFIPYNAGFTIDPDCERVVYAKLTDSSGNVSYINSDGIVLDATAPVISGIENGKTYCSAQTFTVTETYLDKVTVNGVEVAPDGSSQYTLDPAEGTQTIVATDKAGNKTEMTVTVNDGHTYEWQSENGKYWKKCQVCGDETAKRDIPAITINGADKVCVTQEYKFSFTLPEGTTNGVYGYDFETKGEMGLDPVSENGKLYGVVPAEWYDTNQSSFEVYAGATTEDGFEFFVSKTVALQSEHTDADPKDHICDVCGAVLSQHTGGEATCIDRAICDYCGEEYGEPDSTNHDLEHVPAKAATVTETGNIEYWQCKDCGAIFSDPDGKDEIALEDTVIAKLPPKIIEGTGQSVTAGEKKELSFTSNAAFSDFIRAELDGKTLEEKNYTVREGSTVVTLKADYVSTLSAGEHTIGIVSESGTAATKFTVNAKTETETDNNTNSQQTGANNTNSPQTGDNSPLALWIALLFASGCLQTVTLIYGKKKKYNR